MSLRHLADYLEASAGRFPERTAVIDPSGSHLTYAELNRQADALAGFLAGHGVARGDRVGVVLPKSAPAVVTLFGILKAGAAYVPVDFTAPTDRNRGILADCQLSALIVDGRCVDVTPDRRSGTELPVVVVGAGSKPGTDRGRTLTPYEEALHSSVSRPSPDRDSEDLAYILYTSGSTGTPKGVMLTHANATSFVDWCTSVFAPTENDRFSSHAPFHFDLSILDIYLSVRHGAALYLISEDTGKNPKDLARFIEANALTIWYSTPSILMLLLQFGQLESRSVPHLRLVLFAGEVFPVKHLRALVQRWPSPAYYNLYGPTETNVCTFARIPEHIPAERDVPYPIGAPCRHCAAVVLNDESHEVTPGEEGLLYISGPSVFAGYWNRPVENAAAFLELRGVRWYNTGDVVRWIPQEGFRYVGRKDRMVKRRGYRIELGEIERALYLHERVRDVAVIATPDPDTGLRIVAFLSCHEGAVPSIVELKTFCSTVLPVYMSPDRFIVQERLPRTSTDKVDYQALRAELAGAPLR